VIGELYGHYHACVCCLHARHKRDELLVGELVDLDLFVIPRGDGYEDGVTGAGPQCIAIVVGPLHVKFMPFITHGECAEVEGVHR
jgi:hypothetical protein